MTLDSTPREVLALYGAALERAHAGQPATLELRTSGGRRHTVDVSRWCGNLLPGDAGVVQRCEGPTLDLGCGPGRLAAAVAERGVPAVGVDIAETAVQLARARGAVALRRCIFGPLPAEGRWRHVLLADGNIGIGGDPARLLARCRQLLASHGTAIAELGPPGSGSFTTRLHAWDGRRGDPATGHPPRGTGRMDFPWAFVAADDLADYARRCALRVAESWTEAGRWFASLTPC